MYNYEKFIGIKPKFKDDTYANLKFWQKNLRGDDDISISDIKNWSQQNQKNKQRSKQACPFFATTLDHLYINSDGRVYICWVDQNCQLVIGDLNIQTIRKIWNGQRRQELIKMLADREFSTIGKPCSTCLEV